MFSFRGVIMVLMLVGTTNLYICRLNLSTVIVKMAKLDSHSNDTQVYTNFTTRSPENENRRWPEQKQNVILGAFFWGYFSLQVAGGRLSELFGPRLLGFLGLFFSGILNILTPVIVDWNDNVFIASRVVLGFFQAMVFPSCYALTARWMPDNERSTALAFTTIGSCLGTMLASSISGYLADQFDWKTVFYVSGGASLLYSLFYYFIIRNHPDEHFLVSKKEAEFIRVSQGITEKKEKASPFPWKQVLTSRSIISTFIVKFACTWFNWVLALKMPDYMENVLNVSLQTNGYFSSAIFAAMGISNLFGGVLSDWLVKHKSLNKTLIRKIFESFATFGSAFFLVLIPILDAKSTLFLILMISSTLSFGSYSGGDMPIFADISTEFAASIFGIGNMFAMTSGIISPLVAGAILDMDPDNVKQQWYYVFYLTAALNVIGGIVFVIFADATRKDWGKEDEKDLKPEITSIK